MLKKDMFITKVDSLQSIIDKYGLKNQWDSKVEDVRQIIDNYQSTVVFIGKFSAGKSALLNKLMGVDILGEEQTPETSIATELYQATELQQGFTLVKRDGETLKLEYDSFKDVNLSDYEYATCHVDSEFIAKNSDIIFVDMPGFDSSIENHNKAILKYIDKASAFVLVVDVEDGTLQDSSISFLNEIKAFYGNVIVALNKCDKRIPSDVIEIKEHIKEQVQDILDSEVAIAVVSKYQEDTEEQFISALNTLDMQAIFNSKAQGIINDLAEQIIVSLNELKNSQSFSEDELKKAIKDLEYTRSVTESVIRSEKKKLHNKLFNESLPQVIEDIKNALTPHAEELTSIVINNKQEFSNRVNEILRPVLLASVNKEIEKSYVGFLQSVDLSMIDPVDGTKVCDNIKTLFDKLAFALHSHDKIDVKNTFVKDKNTIRNILTVLAITTDVVAPWLEVILIFLPDIISFFSEWIRARKYRELCDKMTYEIIPQIADSLKPNMEKSFLEIEEAMLQEIIVLASKDFNAKKAAVEALQEKTENEKEELARMLTDIDNDILTLANI